MVMFFQSDITGTIVWFIFLFVLIFLYPRLMLSQMIYKLEQSARKIESMSDFANRIIVKKISKKPTKDLRKRISEFFDFFVVEPSHLDPYGIVNKIDRIIRQMEERFEEFVGNVAKKHNQNERQKINYGLRAGMSVHQIAKIVRHNVELAKKFKNLQIAMILQMQMPIIEKIAESELKGTQAFVNGLPIGDSIGPLVAASMMNKSKEIAEDVVMAKEKINGRTAFILKAKGPSPHLGRIDEAITKIMSKNKIDRIITIDAAQKLEGEKTGSVAEGVGFAMGGVQRELIENILLPKKKMIDSIVVKVGMMEAIMPMKKSIYKSVPKAIGLVKEAINRVKKNGKVIIIGVGNSCGIGDTKHELKGLEKVIDDIEKEYKREKELKKRRRGWL